MHLLILALVYTLLEVNIYSLALQRNQMAVCQCIVEQLCHWPEILGTGMGDYVYRTKLGPVTQDIVTYSVLIPTTQVGEWGTQVNYSSP